MEYIVSPLEAELLENELQHLEMIVLLISHNVYVLVQIIFGESPFSSTEVLCHVDGSTVAPEQEFPVQTVGSKVAPY